MQRTHKNVAIVIFIVSIVCALAFTGCQKSVVPSQDNTRLAAAAPSIQKDISDDIWQTWDEAIAPNYVLVTGNAEVDFTPDAGEIVYGELDELGRTTYAVGNITKNLRDAGTANGHDDFAASEDPSGWPNSNPKVEIVTPTGKAYHGYLWNRSHMIADSLGGEAIKCNAVTGTRMQNVGANNGDDAGGMAFCETKARKWLDSHPDGTLYYRADAMYVGNELVPRAVIVNMKSSDGELDMQVIVYNAAKGFDIDYNAADSTTTQNVDAMAVSEENIVDDVQDTSGAAADAKIYITASGKKYHTDPHCKGLSNAKEIIPATIAQAQEKGLEPCSLCGH